MSEQQTDQKYAIHVNLLQDILNYLTEKPFKEANPLIMRIQTTVQLITTTEVEKTEEKTVSKPLELVKEAGKKDESKAKKA